MKRQMPDWVFNQVIDGLQKLLVLRLSGSPPADAVEALALVWEEALTPYVRGYVFEHDEQRLPTAFKRLIRKAERWVQPAQLIAEIPPRQMPYVTFLEVKHPPRTPEQRAKIERNIVEIKKHLDKVVSKGLQPPPPRKPEDLLYEYALVYDPVTGKKRAQPLPDRRKKS